MSKCRGCCNALEMHSLDKTGGWCVLCGTWNDTHPSEPAELRGQISRILAKWHMPTRQSALSEIMQLFEAELARQVRAALIQENRENLAMCTPERGIHTNEWLTDYFNLRIAQLQQRNQEDGR